MDADCREHFSRVCEIVSGQTWPLLDQYILQLCILCAVDNSIVGQVDVQSVFLLIINGWCCVVNE